MTAGLGRFETDFKQHFDAAAAAAALLVEAKGFNSAWRDDAQHACAARRGAGRPLRRPARGPEHRGIGLAACWDCQPAPVQAQGESCLGFQASTRSPSLLISPRGERAAARSSTGPHVSRPARAALSAGHGGRIGTPRLAA